MALIPNLNSPPVAGANSSLARPHCFQLEYQPTLPFSDPFILKRATHDIARATVPLGTTTILSIPIARRLVQSPCLSFREFFGCGGRLNKQGCTTTA